jgi:integrase
MKTQTTADDLDVKNYKLPEGAKKGKLSLGGVPGFIMVATRPKGDGPIKKTFVLQYTPPAAEDRSARTEMVLGVYPLKRLAAAREDARLAYNQVKDKIDPKGARQQAAAHAAGGRTFKEAFEDRFERSLKGTDSEKEIRRIMDNDVLPKIGKVKLRDLRKGHMHDIWDVMEARGCTTQCNRVYEHVRATLNWVVERDKDDDFKANPISRMKLRFEEQENDRDLSQTEVVHFWKVGPMVFAKSDNLNDALRMELLTLQRVGEVIKMKGSEINEADRTWTIPKKNCKNKRSKHAKAHVVPLSDPAWKIVKARMDEYGNGWLFPNTEGEGPIKNHIICQGLARALAPDLERDLPLGRLGMEHFTSHSMRKTGYSQMLLPKNGMNILELTADLLMNHISSVKKSVGRKHYIGKHGSDHLDQMRDAANAWGKFILDLVAGNPVGNAPQPAAPVFTVVEGGKAA